MEIPLVLILSEVLHDGELAINMKVHFKVRLLATFPYTIENKLFKDNVTCMCILNIYYMYAT